MLFENLNPAISCRQRRRTLKPRVKPLRRNPRLEVRSFMLAVGERHQFVAFSDGLTFMTHPRVSLASLASP